MIVVREEGGWMKIRVQNAKRREDGWSDGWSDAKCRELWSMDEENNREKGMFKYNPFSCFGVLHKGDCYYCLTLLGLSPEPKAMRLPVHELTTLHKNKTIKVQISKGNILLIYACDITLLSRPAAKPVSITYVTRRHIHAINSSSLSWIHHHRHSDLRRH